MSLDAGDLQDYEEAWLPSVVAGHRASWADITKHEFDTAAIVAQVNLTRAPSLALAPSLAAPRTTPRCSARLIERRPPPPPLLRLT